MPQSFASCFRRALTLSSACICIPHTGWTNEKPHRSLRSPADGARLSALPVRNHRQQKPPKPKRSPRLRSTCGHPLFHSLPQGRRSPGAPVLSAFRSQSPKVASISSLRCSCSTCIRELWLLLLVGFCSMCEPFSSCSSLASGSRHFLGLATVRVPACGIRFDELLSSPLSTAARGCQSRPFSEVVPVGNQPSRGSQIIQIPRALYRPGLLRKNFNRRSLHSRRSCLHVLLEIQKSS